jgi:hypothetical protein
MLHTRLLIAGCAALLLAAVAAAADKPPFPRLGALVIGAPQNYDDRTYQEKLAKVDMSLLAYYPGWDKSHDMPMEQVVRNIEGRNPDSKVFLYQISSSVDCSSEVYEPLYNKIDQMHWWAYPSGSSGERILSSFAQRSSKPDYVINTTLFAPRDSSGYQWWEYHARWAVQNYYQKAPSIAGLYEDNVFWRPRVDADWNRDGSIDLRTSAQAGQWLREGYRKRFQLMHQLLPAGKYMIGNIADWGDKKSVLTELAGTLNGGIMEGLLGTSHSPERWASWEEMMRWYRKTMDAIAEPKLVMFHQVGDPTDYQAMRYGLASSLMDDAYYVFTKSPGTYVGVNWFDEFDAKLGQATSPPSKTAWQKGVYRRDFEDGIALVNPRGNGPVEVQLEAEFKRIDGHQAPSVNNGQTTKTVQLKDRDGIILLRTSALPTAPKLIAVH